MKRYSVTSGTINAYNYLIEDAKIWVENSEQKIFFDEKEEPFFLAMVNSIDELNKIVEVRYISTTRPVEKVKFEKTVPYINDNNINVNDMASIEDINEVDLLNNLKNRFYSKEIFTNVGPTLIITNPYQKIEKAFGEEVIEEYIKKNDTVQKKNETSHLYDLTIKALKNLKEQQKNQAIVISGESGAGKTETAKNAMKCITYYFSKMEEKSTNQKHEPKNSLEMQILGCNPILEAFGNAKTVRNDNSSRFGKYVTININLETNKIEGAQIKTYLLEKSRICEPAEGERNYHIFYYLLKGAEKDFLEKLFLTSNPSDYNFLSISGCYDVDNINDKELFLNTLEAFKITGFTDPEIQTIFRIVAACLLLGNLTFKQEEDASVINDRSILEKICNLLECNPEYLEMVLTVNIRIIMNESLKTPLKVADSITFRNVFAKELYNRVFNWIVKKLNKKLSPSYNKDTKNTYIGLLDIFGFENFKNNSFEQFCINFTNEKLQQLYINDIFKAEQIEFIKENLTNYLAEITFKDNQSIIDLMDSTGTGLFQLLDDKCITNNDDKSFLDSVKKYHANNNLLKIQKLATNKFSINHTPREVEYITNGFVMKNLDDVKQSMLDVLGESKNNIIKYIFTNAVDEKDYEVQLKVIETEKSQVKNPNTKYLGGKFRNEMKSLMIELSTCVCHYIRCLKPNEIKKQEYFIPTFVFSQIKYLGILDTIRVRKEGFPSRKIFKDFFFRFQVICLFEGKKSFSEYKKIEDDSKFKKLALQCLDFLSPKLTVKDCLVGETKLFMKQNFYTTLEKIRAEKLKQLENNSTMISKFWRGSKVREYVKNLRKKTMFLNNFWRTKKDYFKIQKLRSAAKKIQSAYRVLLIKRTYKYMLVCIYKVQNKIRAFLARNKNKKIKGRIIFLVTKFRKFLKIAKEKRIQYAKGLVNSLIEKSWDLIYNKYQIRAALKIGANAKRFLAQSKHFEKVKRGRAKAYEIKSNKAAILIQKNFRCFQMRSLIKKMRLNAFKIQGFWKSYKYKFLINEMRCSVKIIQRNVRIYLIRKNVINNRLEEYFQHESNRMGNFIGESYKVLFPNLHNPPSENENNSEIPEIEDYENKELLPSFDPLAEVKITSFAKILDIDYLIDSSELYDKSWSKEFNSVYNSNILNNSPIELIYAGITHSFAVNRRGKIFSWGSNIHGQCAQVNKKAVTIPEIVKDSDGNIEPYASASYVSPKAISIDDFGNFKQLQCCEDSSFFVDENGNAFTCGDNSRGLLGLGYTSEIDKPKNITEFKGRVREIKSTGENQILLTFENELYIWPFENYYKNLRPSKLLIDKKVLINSVTCGKNFAIILSKTGVVYSFGSSNINGELGHGDIEPRVNPTPILSLASSGEKITQISCGFKHTLAKSSTGKVFSWGCNSNGQLGIGNNENLSYPALISFDHLFPYRIKILQVSAGFRSSYYLTDSRNILCSGTTGTYENIELPVKFEVNIKTPELADENSFGFLRIMNTWNNGFSVFYSTIGDLRVVDKHLQSRPKLNSIVNTLASKWENEQIEPPYIEVISKYFYQNYMKKPKEERKTSNTSILKVSGKKI